MPAHERVCNFAEAISPAQRRAQRVILALLGLLIAGAWAIVALVPASAAHADFWTSAAGSAPLAVGALVGNCFVALLSAFTKAKAPPLRRRRARRLTRTVCVVVAVGAMYWLWSRVATDRCLWSRIDEATPLIAAIERHIADTGRPPESLEALVPRYLAKVPPRRDGDLYQCRYLIAADGTWVFQFLVPQLGSAQIWDYDTGTPRWAGSAEHGWRRPVPVHGRWCLWP